MNLITASQTAFPPSGSGCCAGALSLPAAPALISNPPGLAAISYRIGTFSTFRRAMLDTVALPDLLAGMVTGLAAPVATTDTQIVVQGVDGFPVTPPFRIKIGSEYLLVTSFLPGSATWTVTRGVPGTYGADAPVILVPPNPFGGWHEGTDTDYQTVFIELWAYLADVLTFYQERIANEAFLGTAVLRDSLLRHVALTGFRPSPGAGATGLVAFSVAKNQSVTIPAGFRVGSKAQSGKPAVVFETKSATAATGDNTSIPLSPLSPTVPFAPGAVVLHGVNNNVSVNDYLLAIEPAAAGQASVYLLQVAAVYANKPANTTTVTWQEMSGQYVQASKQVQIYALRVKAAPFGRVAPLWDALSPLFTNADLQHPTALYATSWELSFRSVSAGSRFTVPNEWYYLPVPSEPLNQLFLDDVYPQLGYTPSTPGWAVLLADGPVFQVLQVTDAQETGKVAYALSGKATRLTFNSPISTLQFPLRGTTVLTGSEALPVQIDLPIPDPIGGSVLALAGLHAGLVDGQTVVLQGNLWDPVAQAPTPMTAAEALVLNGAPQVDARDNVTFVNLRRPLVNQYVRSTCTLLANIAEVTQGETVKDEVLGSADGSAFQAYRLKQKPLTYLPSTDAQGLTAAVSQLTVIVNGVAWTEQPNLAGSGPRDQVFTAAQDDSGTTTILFGDGSDGARPPSGFNNVHARYRKGLGTAGNLAPGAIRQLVDSTPGLQKVVNPIAVSGGDDPESASDIRSSAPASMQSFDRAVSVSDYAALALRFPGIAKASAAWVVRDPATGRAVSHPYIQLTAAPVDRTPVTGTGLGARLRQFLNGRRDPNVPLRIQSFTPVYMTVAVAVSIDPSHPNQATLNQVIAALNPGVNPDGAFGYFAFERLSFGGSIFLSALYAAVQAIPGVADANVTVLQLAAEAESTAPHDIAIGPTQIAVIDSAASPASSLTVTGSGGFADR